MTSTRPGSLAPTGGDARGLRDPRILAIMGSGETAPTMARVHRALFDRLDGAPLRGAIVDTPYGFQENADQLSARTLDFFATSVGHQMALASYRSRAVDPAVAAAAVARLREARYVMAGPGSPSYALAHWADGPIPELLAGKLATGGILTMASAAALTLGVVTLPVYEIYKVGAEPHWLPGLDLLGRATGLRAAVVPHFDNAEGGNHDTRYCYMGERRLRQLEGLLPDGAFILGVDSHTALILDLDAGTASVAGLGGVTVRAQGRSTMFPSGATVPLAMLAAAASGQGDAGPGIGASGPPTRDAREHGAGGAQLAASCDREPDGAALFAASFDRALDVGDASAAVAALLDLDGAIEGRLRSGEDSPELDAAVSMLRALIVRLGEVAEHHSGERHRIIDPLVAALLDIRARARAAQDWATADLVRARILEAGIEVSDGADATTWRLAPRSEEAPGIAMSGPQPRSR